MVFGFEGFAAGFREGMAGERSVWQDGRMAGQVLAVSKSLAEGTLPCLKEMIWI